MPFCCFCHEAAHLFIEFALWLGYADHRLLQSLQLELGQCFQIAGAESSKDPVVTGTWLFRKQKKNRICIMFHKECLIACQHMQGIN